MDILVLLESDIRADLEWQANRQSASILSANRQHAGLISTIVLMKARIYGRLCQGTNISVSWTAYSSRNEGTKILADSFASMPIADTQVGDGVFFKAFEPLP